MDVIVEKFCQACDIRHQSTVWYYRQSIDPNTKVWLCGMRYLLLDSHDKQVWRDGKWVNGTVQRELL